MRRWCRSSCSDRSLPAAPSSSSDADILVVLRDSETPFLDRAALFRDYFNDIGVGVDLFVYTQQEISGRSVPVAATALRTGVELYPAT